MLAIISLINDKFDRKDEAYVERITALRTDAKASADSVVARAQVGHVTNHIYHGPLLAAWSDECTLAAQITLDQALMLLSQ